MCWGLALHAMSVSRPWSCGSRPGGEPCTGWMWVVNQNDVSIQLN